MSWVYVDQSRLLCQPETLNPCLEMISSYLNNNFPPENTILVNIDSKFSPQITGALAALLGYRQVVINPEATTRAEKGVNLKLRLPCNVKRSDTFVMIDDTLTSGGTVLNVAKLVRSELKTDSIESKFFLLVCLLHGNAGEVKKLFESEDVGLHWFTDIKTLVSKIPVINHAQQTGLNEELGMKNSLNLN